MRMDSVSHTHELSNEAKELSPRSPLDKLRFDPREVSDGHATPYAERQKHLPKTHAFFRHIPPGESIAVPNPNTELGKEAKKELESRGLIGIIYEKCFPKFDSVSVETVEIKSMTDNRPGNFRQADQAVADRWNAEKRDGRSDWTRSDVSDYRHEQKLTWHECEDLKTCQLIPRSVHQAFTHTGGVSEYKYRNGIQGFGD